MAIRHQAVAANDDGRPVGGRKMQGALQLETIAYE
jgi:hypothetical protein